MTHGTQFVKPHMHPDFLWSMAAPVGKIPTCEQQKYNLYATTHVHTTCINLIRPVKTWCNNCTKSQQGTPWGKWVVECTSVYIMYVFLSIINALLQFIMSFQNKYLQIIRAVDHHTNYLVTYIFSRLYPTYTVWLMHISILKIRI
jgi:hypothetical protein